MDVIGVIPARYRSTRLPFKLLKPILGKSLLQWTWTNAKSARLLDKLIIACDDLAIKDEAESFGAEVIMTSPEHKSGTDRISEAVWGMEARVIINIQADEPLLPAVVIDKLAQEMLNDKNVVMATVKKKIKSLEEINNPNVVKVVCDRHDFAICFSRAAIPYYRDDNYENKLYYKHIGLYAYTKDFLYTFKNLPHSYLEEAEKLEQMRVLESGYKIKVIESQYESVGVDTQEDLVKVEDILSRRGS